MNQSEVEFKAKYIADFLCEYDYNQLSSANMNFGKLGIAFFLFQYYHYSEEEKYGLLGQQILEKVIEGISDNSVNFDSEKLILDLGKLLEYVNRKSILECDTNAILNDLDIKLNEQLSKFIEEKNIDVITGALGIGYYFISRLASNNSVKLYLNNLVDSIASVAISDERNSVYWNSTLFDDNRIYLGLHGSAATIIFLSKMVALDINKEKALDTINKASKYLLSKISFDEKCMLPIIIGVEKKGPRIQWAYGDLMPGLALIKAGKLLNKNTYIEAAVKVFENASDMIDEEGAVRDEGIGYGLSGTALLFIKIYKETGNNIFLEFYHKCLERVLSAELFSDSGEIKYEPFDKCDIPGTTISLNSGIAGIGSVLTAHLQNDYDSLEELFFL